VNSIVSIQFLLKLNDSLISLIQSGSQSNHNVSLLEKQLLVTIYLGFVFFDLGTLFLDFLELLLVFLTDEALLFF